MSRSRRSRSIAAGSPESAPERVEAMGSVEAARRDLLISTKQEHTGVLVAVQDSGPGIRPDHLDRVFNSFYTTKPSGTGTGLSICRSIIDAHGGAGCW
jgi:signal transduction histidine kinase